MSSGSHQYLQHSSQKSNSPSRLGDIEHLTQLSANLSALCLNSEYSDIVLIVEGHKLNAHKVSSNIISKLNYFFCSLIKLKYYPCYKYFYLKISNHG